jgi:hypothetical protein
MRTAFAATLLGAALVLPAPAAAQSKEDIANADALFNAAKAMLEAGQYADACGKFAESKRLAPGLGVTLYLADCYERIGRTASAWTEFKSAEGLARARRDPRADLARDRAHGLEPKLERLTIDVAPTVPRAGLHVLLDGAPVPPEEWGLGIAVDPGDHVVLASAPEHSDRSFAAHLSSETPTLAVHINALDATEPVPRATADAAPSVPGESRTTAIPFSNPPPEPAPSENPGERQRWIGVGAGVLGIVGLGIGSGFGLDASSKKNASNQNGNCNAADYCDSNGLRLRSEAGNSASLSNLFFVAGGVAIAAGVAVYVTAPREKTALVIAPVPRQNGGGVLLRAAF